jgi:hypothetical protein
MDMFPRSEEGHIIEFYQMGDFCKDLDKKRRINPLGENVYLLTDGSIVRDEDKIIAAQGIWKERAYAPPGTLFAKRGYMYNKTFKNFSNIKNEHS